jgi:predicted DNA-binding protein
MGPFICEKDNRKPIEVSDTYVILSDSMSSHRITVRVPKPLAARLQQNSRSKGQTPSELVRVALEKYLGEPSGERSTYDLAKEAGIIGCARGLPENLSTNPRYFEGFGKSK